jgi:predicted nuclease with RNAse H fold
VYAGIDLAALPKNMTGMAAYDGRRYFCQTARSDEEIWHFILGLKPSVVAIDAPLTLPRGRCCFDDACCGTRKIRECDRALIRMGYRVFPPGFSFMKQLTLRGKALRERLESSGFKVIEAHPRTSKRILGIGRFEGANNEHESDACAAALTAFLYDRGECIEAGDDEGIIVIPAGKGALKKIK